jgi:hypothetical protein
VQVNVFEVGLYELFLQDVEPKLQTSLHVGTKNQILRVVHGAG